MGIPHFTLDLREDFRAAVVDDFLAEYEAGRTPNPCVRCNGLVRFDAMLELAERLGAARLATGHYARVADDAGGPLVAAAADGAKDQSYMLARLAPDTLERLRFPLGELDEAAGPRSRACRRPAGGGQARVARISASSRAWAAGSSCAATAARPGPASSWTSTAAWWAATSGQRNFTVGQRGAWVSARASRFTWLPRTPGSGRVAVGRGARWRRAG